MAERMNLSEGLSAEEVLSKLETLQGVGRKTLFDVNPKQIMPSVLFKGMIDDLNRVLQKLETGQRHEFNYLETFAIMIISDTDTCKSEETGL